MKERRKEGKQANKERKTQKYESKIEHFIFNQWKNLGAFHKLILPIISNYVNVFCISPLDKYLLFHIILKLKNNIVL